MGTLVVKGLTYLKSFIKNRSNWYLIRDLSCFLWLNEVFLETCSKYTFENLRMAGIDFELHECYCEADFNHSGLGFMQLVRPFFIHNSNWEKTLKETRNSSKIQPSGFEKKNSSTPKNVPQNTNEHTCDNLRYVSVLICLRWSVVWFWGVIRKNIFMLEKTSLCLQLC